MTRSSPKTTLFPTRRSSDLAVAAVVGKERNPVALRPELRARIALHARFGPRAAVHPLDYGQLGSGQRVVARRPERIRSEEHTSELQSPYDVVCRLLLEKKTQ